MSWNRLPKRRKILVGYFELEFWKIGANKWYNTVLLAMGAQCTEHWWDVKPSSRRNSRKADYWPTCGRWRREQYRERDVLLLYRNLTIRNPEVLKRATSTYGLLHRCLQKSCSLLPTKLGVCVVIECGKKIDDSVEFQLSLKLVCARYDRCKNVYLVYFILLRIY